LADFAKALDGRVVCSAAAMNRANTAERQHWISHGDTVLRGRSESTQVFAPTVSS
jgi:class 3 adenylate cyclase